MEAARLVSALRRRWLVLVVTTLLGAVAGLAYAATRPVEYESTATVFFSLDRGTSVSEFTAGSTYAQDLIPSYAEVARTPAVLDPVIDGLQLDSTAAGLARRVGAVVQPNTVLMDLTVTDEDPATAANVANAISRELSRVVADLSPRGGVEAPRIRVSTTSPAVPADSPSSTAPALLVLAALLGGLALGVAVVVVRESVSRTVRDHRGVAAVTGAPVVGRIARERGADRRPVPTSTHPYLTRAEGYRILRANLSFLSRGVRHRCVVVTSAATREGRTTTAVNLAVAMAHASQKVLLIDADLRRPRVAELLGLDGSTGLSSVLRGEAEVYDVVRQWNDTRPDGRTDGDAPDEVVLDVLPAGPVPERPGELLSSRVATELLTTLRARYDVVIIDTPPLLPVADAGILAGGTGEALLVVDAGRTQHRQLAEAVDRLLMVGARVQGVVLNRVATRDRRGYPPAVAPERRSAPADVTASS